MDKPDAHDVPLVDTHAHVWTADMPLPPNAWFKPPGDATVEQFVATLEKHGVKYGVLSAVGFFDDYNDYTLDATRRYKQLRTTVIVPPTIDPYIMRLMRDDGAVGVRLQWRHIRRLPDITAPEYTKFFRRVRDLDWHVHINQEAALLEEPIAVLQAAGVKLVIDHFGHPTRGEGAASRGFQAVLRAVDAGRTWVKLSGGYRLESPDVARDCARALLARAGPERLLWGSNWPFAAFEHTMGYDQAIAAFREWVPDANARRIIGGDTAMKLYFA